MLKWCAYCQGYIGEREPFDQFLISHGVCEACAPKVLTFSRADKEALQGLRQFFIALQRAVRDPAPLPFGAILAESRRLAVPPLDLMMGVFQPLLEEVGALWASGQLTVAMEHRFTAMVSDWVTSHRAASAEGSWVQPGQPRLILMNAEGNFHVLGLQMAQCYFTALGIPAMTIVPGLPLPEILALLDQHRPQVLGFSVALPHQVKQVLEVADRVQALAVPPAHILVGGPAARQGLEVAPGLGIQVCRELADILPFLQTPSPVET